MPRRPTSHIRRGPRLGVSRRGPNVSVHYNVLDGLPLAGDAAATAIPGSFCNFSFPIERTARFLDTHGSAL